MLNNIHDTSVSNENFIKLNNNQKTISSIDLCELINKIRKEEGVKAELEHSDLMKKIRLELDINNKGIDERGKIFAGYYLDKKGENRPSYNLPQKEALQVIASESKKVRRRLIDEIERLTIENIQLKSNQPLSYEEMVQRTLLLTSERIKTLENKIEEQKPKVLFAESVETSKNTILIRDFVKILVQKGIDIGEKRLFDWLRDNEYLCKFGSSKNKPTQKAMVMGLFEIKETAITHSSGNIILNITPKITGKGQTYFVNKFLNSDQILLA